LQSSRAPTAPPNTVHALPHPPPLRPLLPRVEKGAPTRWLTVALCPPPSGAATPPSSPSHRWRPKLPPPALEPNQAPNQSTGASTCRSAPPRAPLDPIPSSFNAAGWREQEDPRCPKDEKKRWSRWSPSFAAVAVVATTGPGLPRTHRRYPAPLHRRRIGSPLCRCRWSSRAAGAACRRRRPRDCGEACALAGSARVAASWQAGHPELQHMEIHAAASSRERRRARGGAAAGDAPALLLRTGVTTRLGKYRTIA
jgi:hypothetical protein